MGKVEGNNSKEKKERRTESGFVVEQYEKKTGNIKII